MTHVSARLYTVDYECKRTQHRAHRGLHIQNRRTRRQSIWHKRLHNDINVTHQARQLLCLKFLSTRHSVTSFKRISMNPLTVPYCEFQLKWTETQMLLLTNVFFCFNIVLRTPNTKKTRVHVLAHIVLKLSKVAPHFKTLNSLRRVILYRTSEHFLARPTHCGATINSNVYIQLASIQSAISAHMTRGITHQASPTLSKETRLYSLRKQRHFERMPHFWFRKSPELSV